MLRRSRTYLLSALVSLITVGTATPQVASQDLPGAPLATYEQAASFTVKRPGLHAPILFVGNKGQAAPDILYTAHTAALNVQLAKSSVNLQSIAAAEGGQLRVEDHRIEFLGASPETTIQPLEEQPSRMNYLIGKDRSLWSRDVATYQRVRYKNLYPGIDLIFYNGAGRLEYDFVVAAGADPNQIRLRLDNTRDARLNAAGDIVLANGVDLRIAAPVLYQNSVRGKQTIEGGFKLRANGEVAFRVGDYDPHKTLVIDPTLLYSTYLGGVHDDEPTDMKIDSAGNVYVVGYSGSQNFPVSSNAYQSVRKNIGSLVRNVVITKFSATGTLLYSTFLGGSTNDYGQSIVVDSSGNAYVTGYTSSTDFPVTANALQSTAASGGTTAFLSELGASGSTLLYSTYFGPTKAGGTSSTSSLAIDSTGKLYLTGNASSGLPTTATAYKPTLATGKAAFVAVFDLTQTGTSQLVSSTYYGTDTPAQNSTLTGNIALALALDSTGNVWITGQTYTNNLPTTANALQPSLNALSSACSSGAIPLNSAEYLAEFSADLKKLVYASYLSGQTEASTESSCSEYGYSLAFDASGNLFVLGVTASDKAPVTSGTLQSSFPSLGGNSAFVSTLYKLSPDGTKLVWGTYLGGASGGTYMDKVLADAAGNLWVAGQTSSANYPVSANAYQPTNAGGFDGTLTELSPSGATALYSTYIGGSYDDGIRAFALDANDNAYIAGVTASTNFPVTGNAFQTSLAPNKYDGSNWFFSVLGTANIAGVFPSTTGNGGDSTITVNGTGFTQGSTCTLTLGTTTISSTTAAASADGTSIACHFPLAGVTAGTYSIVVTNPGGSTVTKSSAVTVASGGQPNVWVSIVGRQEIRVGTTSTVTVNYGNSGTVDAFLTQMKIDLPSNITASYDVGVPSTTPSGTSIATTFATSTGTTIPLMISSLPAGSSGSMDLTIADAVNNDNYTITATIGHPWYSSASTAQTDLTSQSQTLTTASNCAPPVAGQPTVSSCLAAYLTNLQAQGLTPLQVKTISSQMLAELNQTQAGDYEEVVNGINYFRGVTNNEPGSMTISGIPQSDDTVIYHINNLTQQITVKLATLSCTPEPPIPNYIADGPFMTCVFPNVVAPQGMGTQILGESFNFNPLTQTNPGIPPPDSCFKITQDINYPTFTASTRAQDSFFCNLQLDAPSEPYVDMGIVIAGGGPGGTVIIIPPDPPSPDPPPANHNGSSGSSVDPNEMAGSSGDGSKSHYIRNTAPLSYTIDFENQATATLPASKVVVTDQVDPTKVNLSTVTLGTIHFGPYVVHVPGTTNDFNTTYSISSSLSVRIQGSLNQATGLLTWTFTSIDPSTGLPPTDPTVGFLPPDANGVIGQASVSFNAMPISTLPTGTQIQNTASIVFDSNAAIATNTWLNTIDVSAPASKVASLPATIAASATGTTTPINVSWAGTDNGSGILNYSVYVSDNGAAYTVWQPLTSATSATYNGLRGHTYAFFVLAQDAAGNPEPAKTSAEASVQIVGTASTTALTANPTSATPGQTVTLTATVTAPAGSTFAPTGTVTFLNGTASLGTATLNASGVATLTTTALPTGINSISAMYGGDSNFGSSTSSMVSVTVALIPTATLLSSSPNPANLGASITFTATVSPSSGSGTPSGSVTFLNGTATLGSGTLASGKATYSTSSLTAGTYSITAKYSGDITYATSTSSALAQVVTAPAIVLSVSPATLTINRGASGSATLSITSTGGFSSAVTFACSGLPAYTTCTFAPASVTPTGATAVTTNVTIATNVATARSQIPPYPGTANDSRRVVFACLALGLGCFFRRNLLRRKLKSATWASTPFLLFTVALLGWAIGCSSGGFTSSVTPTGTSNVTITATGGGLTQTTTLSITVQ